MFLQVGAFGEQSNALQLANKLSSSGISDVSVHHVKNEYPALYRVRIGPVSDVSAYDRLAAEVERLQISQTQLVIENH